MLDQVEQLVEALIHNIMIAGVIVAGILVAAVIYAVRNRAAAADAYQRLDGESPPSILLLGPSDAGKTTLHRAGLALAGEKNSNEPQTSTRGLVRRLLLLPTGDNNFRRRVLLCDAGGGRDERRQWIELVRGNHVGALIYVSDARDTSAATLDLFSQLANAPWAKRSTLLLALTRRDLVEDTSDDTYFPDLPRQRIEACQAREAEYRAACPRPLSCHLLDARDQLAARRLLVEAVANATAEESQQPGERT